MRENLLLLRDLSGPLKTKSANTVPKYVNINNLDDIAYKYNNTYYRAIKMKPVNFKPDTNIDYGVAYNDINPKFKVSDHVRILKYKYFCILQIG